MRVVGVIKDGVEACLRIKKSPEQIGDALALSKSRVSHDIIYQRMASDRDADAEQATKQSINGKRFYRQRRKMGCGEKTPNWVDIDLRPLIFDAWERFGEREAKLIQD